MADLALSGPRRRHLPSLPAVLDGVERTTLVLLFARMIVTNWVVMQTPGHAFNILLITSEGLAVALLLVRRPSRDVSHRGSDWLLAFAASCAPLLVQPGGGAPLIPPALGFGLLVGGLFTQVSAKVVLGRSFGIVAANRGVRVGGPYRLVRHPMYLGYMAVQVGYLLMAPNLANLLIYAACFSVQAFRILAEERLLAHDPAYRDFQARTRWRLLPGLF